jgi:hypothetical protein
MCTLQQHAHVKVIETSHSFTIDLMHTWKSTIKTVYFCVNREWMSHIVHYWSLLVHSDNIINSYEDQNLFYRMGQYFTVLRILKYPLPFFRTGSE